MIVAVLAASATSFSIAGAGYVTAILLAMLFWYAGFAKLRTRPRVVEEFAAMGIRSPELAARILPIAEVLTAVLLAVVPWVGAVVALGLLVVFTIVLARVVRSGAHVTCACFGAVADRPATWVDLVRNGALIVAAAVAVGAERVDVTMPEITVPLGAFVLGAVCLRVLRERAAV